MSKVLDYINNSVNNLVVASHLIKMEAIDIESVERFKNGYFHYNLNENLEPLFLCSDAQKLVNHTQDELYSINRDSFKKRIHGRFTNRYILPKIIELCNNLENINKSFVYYREVFNHGKNEYCWHLTVKHIHNEEINLNFSIELSRLDEDFAKNIITDRLQSSFNYFHRLKRLSKRELQILGEIIKGNSRKDFAKLNDISPLTYDIHLKNIKFKLELSSVTEIIQESYLIDYYDQ